MILFNIAFLPQFVNPALGHPMVQLLVLGITLVLIGLAVDASVGLLSGGSRTCCGAAAASRGA